MKVFSILAIPKQGIRKNRMYVACKETSDSYYITKNAKGVPVKCEKNSFIKFISGK